MFSLQYVSEHSPNTNRAVPKQILIQPYLLFYDKTKARNKGHLSLDSYMDLSKYDYQQKGHHFA